jgi:4-amino-4-deoxy-L-arabinose transferase-like glycosyltransferase
MEEQGDGRIGGWMEAGTEKHGDGRTGGGFQFEISNLKFGIHWLAAGYWFFIGLGILAKGPATLVFAGAFGLALLATRGRRAWLWNWRYWIWLPVAVLVAAPWYVYIAQHAGDTLREQFLGYEITERIAGTPHGHGGPPGQYLLISLAGLLPWTVFVPGTLIIAFRRRREDLDMRLLLIWLAVPWIILELIHAKLPHYILPCYVPLMILLARLLEEGLRSPRPLSAYPRDEQRVLRAWPVILIGMGIVGGLAALIRWDAGWGWAAIATGVVLAVGFAIVARLLRRSFAQAFVAAAGATVAFHVVVGLALLPSLEPYRLSRLLATRINALAEPGDRILLCGYEEPSTFFYLNAPGRPVAPGGVGDLLSGTGGPAWLAITQRALDRLPADVADRMKPHLLPEPVRGFNYVKTSPETIWLAHLP